MKQLILRGWLVALLLGGCSMASGDGPSSGREIVSQANEGDKIAFDVVKLDDSVVNVLRAQGEPAFHERFKKYTPPPDIKIEVGDTVSVVIWEAAANGLFGNSLAEWSVPPGVASRLLGSATSGIGALSTAGQSLSTSSTEVLSQLLGGAPGQGLAAGGTQALTAVPGQDPSTAGAAGLGLGACAARGAESSRLGRTAHRRICIRDSVLHASRRFLCREARAG